MNERYLHSRLGIGGVALIALLVVPRDVRGFTGGPPAGRNGSTASGGDSCAICHLSGTGSGSVEIRGTPPPGGYIPNFVYNLSVVVSDPVKVGAGFQLSVENGSGTHVGTLSLTDVVNTQLNTGDPHWVNHTSAGVTNAFNNWVAGGNSASFPVKWTAPASDVGPVTFWAAGNAINHNGSSSGDNIYLTSVTVPLSSAIPALSTWGMVVMFLLLLSIGTILLIRREESVARAIG